jgi:hypothetical protein
MPVGGEVGDLGHGASHTQRSSTYIFNRMEHVKLLFQKKWANARFLGMGWAGVRKKFSQMGRRIGQKNWGRKMEGL